MYPCLSREASSWQNEAFLSASDLAVAWCEDAWPGHLSGLRGRSGRAGNPPTFAPLVIVWLGLVSGALVGVYLSKADDSGGGNVSGGAATPVVVASQGVPAGTRVTEDMVTLKSISSEAILPDVFLKTKDVVGQVTRVPLVAGEEVIPSKVSPTRAEIANVENPALAYVVPEGRRG